MDPLHLILAALSGGIVAMLLTVFGGGGSVLAVPLLLYVVGVRDPHMAIGADPATAPQVAGHLLGGGRPGLLRQRLHRRGHCGGLSLYPWQTRLVPSSVPCQRCVQHALAAGPGAFPRA